MDIQTSKINLINEILEIDNPLLLQSVLNLIKKEDFISDDKVIVNEQILNYESILSTDIKRKLVFIKEYLSLENEETINKIENILWKKKDFWDELSSSQKDEIHLGIKQLDEGKKVSFESFLNKVS
jgi:hypothetical protein